MRVLRPRDRTRRAQQASNATENSHLRGLVEKTRQILSCWLQAQGNHRLSDLRHVHVEPMHPVQGIDAILRVVQEHQRIRNDRSCKF